MAKRKVLIEVGQVFGYLTVIEMAGKDKFSNYLYKCKCVCGKEKTLRGSSLISGHDTSCTCKKGKWSREKTYYNTSTCPECGGSMAGAGFLTKCVSCTASGLGA